jgi:NADPH:quinone reductase-like Zn-dependent oxidoreductase
LITRGQLQRGESILIVGAGGGVNLASLQIAKYIGAKVYVVGSNMAKLKRAAELGADELIDRSSNADWSKAIYALTNKRGVDVVVDNVGAGTLPLSMRAASKGGRILTVGNTGGPKFEFDNRYMFAKQLTYIGSTMGTRADFAQVMSLIFAGKLRTVIDEMFALRDARRAHERLEQGEFFGKIVLQP